MGSANTYPYGFAVHPTSASTIFVGGSSQLYKSTNGGATWTYTNLPSYYYIYDILLQRGNPSTIHGAAYYWDSGLQTNLLAYVKSTDGGTSWFAKKITADYGYPYAIAVDPTNAQIVYVCGYCYAGGSYVGKVYKSTNGGTDFVDKTGVISGYTYDLAHDPVGPANCMQHPVGAHRTTDGGDTWTGITACFLSELIRICPTNTSMLYSGTSLGTV
jgi:photosystem II stability/assembly factor-like uncharacterized protein